MISSLLTGKTRVSFRLFKSGAVMRCFSRAANRSPPAVSGHGPLFDKEGQGYKRQKSLRPRGEDGKAILRWCKQYGIGRSMPGSTIEISVPALDGETWRWQRWSGAIAAILGLSGIDDVGVAE
ncbi:hypothetical protein [Rhizobium leguminosarum]|uniref:hypothetical protein n=1 Tax=Rhizobium leguminosarum TaxID=384 RepID=UPI002F93E2FF